MIILELCLGLSVFLIADITSIAVLVRNKRIRKYGKLKRAEVKDWKRIIYPPLYILKICYDYDKEGHEKVKRIVTGGWFAQKYEREKYIDIILMPKPDCFYLKETKWVCQNIISVIGIIITTMGAGEVLLILLGTLILEY